MGDYCEFCRSLEIHKFSDRVSDDYNKLHHTAKLYHEYTVALVAKCWTRESGKRHAGRTTDYRNQGIGFKLNYCPECGRKLKGAKGNG